MHPIPNALLNLNSLPDFSFYKGSPVGEPFLCNICFHFKRLVTITKIDSKKISKFTFENIRIRKNPHFFFDITN